MNSPFGRKEFKCCNRYSICTEYSFLDPDVKHMVNLLLELGYDVSWSPSSVVQIVTVIARPRYPEKRYCFWFFFQYRTDDRNLLFFNIHAFCTLWRLTSYSHKFYEPRWCWVKAAISGWRIHGDLGYIGCREHIPAEQVRALISLVHHDTRQSTRRSKLHQKAATKHQQANVCLIIEYVF